MKQQEAREILDEYLPQNKTKDEMDLYLTLSRLAGLVDMTYAEFDEMCYITTTTFDRRKNG